MKFCSIYKHGSGELATCTKQTWGYSEKIFSETAGQNLKIISQECSLDDPFWKIFAKFWSIQRHGPGEWGLLALFRHEEILKNSTFFENAEFHGIVSLVTHFKNCSIFWPINKYGPGEWGLLSFYWHKEISNKSSLKPQVRFWNNFTGIFLGWSFSKIVN